MKKKMFIITMILSAMLILSACGNNISNNDNNANPVEDNQENASTNDTQQEEDIDDTAGNDLEGTDEGLPNDSNSESEGTRLAGSLITVAELESGIAIGATQEDVSIFFDSHPYTEVTSAFDGRDAWRYDIGAQPEYSFESETDLHDQEGILNGDVPLQIFIYFDEEGIVNGYTAYQAAEDGTINIYQTLGDGTRKVDTI